MLESVFGGRKVLCVPMEEASMNETCGISQEKKFCENKEGSILLGGIMNVAEG